MAKSKKEGYIVPKEEQHAYKMLIQRANRRVKANLKYLKEHNITNEHTERALVGGFADPLKWSTGRMPFSRSNKGRYVWNADKEVMEFREFKNKAEFDQYIAHLNKWGKQTKKGELFDAHPKKVRQDYKSAIIKSLNEVKDHYNISLPNGQIPKEVIDELDSLTTEQITNFFGNGDPSEDVEISQFSSDEYLDVENAEDFKDVILSRIASIKRFY